VTTYININQFCNQSCWIHGETLSSTCLSTQHWHSATYSSITPAVQLAVHFINSSLIVSPHVAVTVLSHSVQWGEANCSSAVYGDSFDCSS